MLKPLKILQFVHFRTNRIADNLLDYNDVHVQLKLNVKAAELSAYDGFSSRMTFQFLMADIHHLHMQLREMIFRILWVSKGSPCEVFGSWILLFTFLELSSTL